MRKNAVKNDFHPSLVRHTTERLKILLGTEHLVYLHIIGSIVAMVGIRLEYGV